MVHNSEVPQPVLVLFNELQRSHDDLILGILDNKFRGVMEILRELKKIEVSLTMINTMFSLLKIE